MRSAPRSRWRETDPRRVAEFLLLRWWGMDVFRKERLIGKLVRTRQWEWDEPETVEEFDALWAEGEEVEIDERR